MAMLQTKIVRKEKGVNDFVLLEPVNEARPPTTSFFMTDPFFFFVCCRQQEAFLKNLEERYKDNTIYTFIGPVVVSVNPYKAINIYTVCDDHVFFFLLIKPWSTRRTTSSCTAAARSMSCPRTSTPSHRMRTAT